MSMGRVIRVPRDRMQDLVDRLGHHETPTTYSSPNVLVRELFWRRLDALVAASRTERRRRVLDFGGGNGVLLPTLSRHFESVVCVDLDGGMAEELVQRDGLANVRILVGELEELALEAESFDVVFAPDVLEHILDLERLAGEFQRLLAPGGELLVTAPSENRFYELGRRVFGYVKPHDHYRTAEEVEEIVARQIPLLERRYFPVRIETLGVFSIARFVKPAR